MGIYKRTSPINGKNKSVLMAKMPSPSHHKSNVDSNHLPMAGLLLGLLHTYIIYIYIHAVYITNQIGVHNPSDYW